MITGSPDGSPIDLAGVSRRFGRRQALDDVSLRIGAGEIVGLVGPNGAGKTTLLRVLAGYLDADRGKVAVDGPIGYLAEGSPLPPEMRVGEYLRFRAALKRIARAERADAVAAAIARAALGDVARQVIGTLSKGYRQRVGLADALLGDPPVLLLDEPASGLDPRQTRELRELLGELAGKRPARAGAGPATEESGAPSASGSIIIMSTHALGELESLAARVVVIAGGKVAGDGTPAALRAQTGKKSLEDAVIALC